MGLSGKKILIISPQAWDKVRVSKHHYAISLAENGNTVYFLDPPTDSVNGITVTGTGINGLSVLRYRPFFPVSIRFRFGAAFRMLMRIQSKKIVDHLGGVDIVWCFDPNLYADLGKFKAPVKIFHPVDVFTHAHARRVAASADVIFSVSPTILEAFRDSGKPRYFINHGLGKDFVAAALKEDKSHVIKGDLQVGYIGNLLIPYMDRSLFRKVIEDCPEVRFHLIGPYGNGQSSLGDGDKEAMEFIAFLKSCPNVILYGPLGSAELSSRLLEMDAFIICYSDKYPGYDLSNSHKILEYLSTGRPVITTPILAYMDKQNIVTMPVGLDSEQYPSFFVEAIRNAPALTDPSLQEKRKQYALSNTYAHQLQRIEDILSDLKLLA